MPFGRYWLSLSSVFNKRNPPPRLVLSSWRKGKAIKKRFPLVWETASAWNLKTMLSLRKRGEGYCLWFSPSAEPIAADAAKGRSSTAFSSYLLELPIEAFSFFCIGFMSNRYCFELDMLLPYFQSSFYFSLLLFVSWKLMLSILASNVSISVVILPNTIFIALNWYLVIKHLYGIDSQTIYSYPLYSNMFLSWSLKLSLLLLYCLWDMASWPLTMRR